MIGHDASPNDALRFLLEFAALGPLGYGGWRAGSDPAGVALAVGLLARPGRPLAAGALGLLVAGHYVLARERVARPLGRDRASDPRDAQ